MPSRTYQSDRHYTCNPDTPDISLSTEPHQNANYYWHTPDDAHANHTPLQTHRASHPDSMKERRSSELFKCFTINKPGIMKQTPGCLAQKLAVQKKQNEQSITSLVGNNQKTRNVTGKAARREGTDPPRLCVLLCCGAQSWPWHCSRPWLGTGV
jgi:hypothetical protein